MKKHYREENDCLNCGTTLEGKYCHKCGQENLEIHESFGHMMNHAISDYFHFDHQFFHTLKPLLFKPGFLTKEYMAGRRVQYLHPVKMYIFISIVYFLLLFQSGHEPVSAVRDKIKPVSAAKILDSVNRELDSAGIKIGNDKNLSTYQKKALINKIDNGGIPKTGFFKITKNDTTKSNEPSVGFASAISDTTYQQYTARQNKLRANERDGFITHTINKKQLLYREKYGPMAREVFVEEFKHNIPKMMFLMLPLLALILRMTFWNSKKYYVEHLIYTFHLHCFLFLFLAIIMLLQLVIPGGWQIGDWIDWIAFVFIAWYIYRSLRVVYHYSRWRTASKMIGM
ncbi:MAG: DUF3667 domain-containing protein, partial [Mucilaginibacter sp.]